MASKCAVIESAPASANAGDVLLGALDHQVHVDEAVLGVHAVAQRLHHQRPHGQRGDEVPVHDVDVDHARAGVEDRVDLLAQPREVGGEDARRDADAVGVVRRHR